MSMTSSALPKRRRYSEEDAPTEPRVKEGLARRLENGMRATEPRVKKGLAGKLENGMRAIVNLHQPPDLGKIHRKGWANLTARVDAAMKKRGFTSRDTRSAIQRFWNHYAGFTLAGPVVIGLADGLGLAGRLRRTFIAYGLLLRGRDDTRQLLYDLLVAEGFVPSTKQVVDAFLAYHHGSKTVAEIEAAILPSASTCASP